MSYDLDFYLPAPGTDLSAILNSVHADENESGDPDPKLIQRIDGAARERLAASVKDALPDGDWEDFRSDQVVEVTCTTEGRGFQVCAYETRVAMHAPYWASGRDGVETVKAMISIVRALQDQGLVCYDPQLDKELDPSADISDMISLFCNTSDMLGHGPTRPSKPWWKFW